MSRSSKFAKVGAVALIQIIWASVAHAADTNYELKPISLPGATTTVALDYFAYDRATGKLWVPASNTGSVDVIDEKTDVVSQVTGFQTGEVELRGRKVKLGPTAVSIGDGVVYIGNRGDSTLCPIDSRTLEHGEFFQVAPISAGRAAAPDGARGFLFVACGDHVVSVDTAHDGKIIDSLQTGAGLDNIDYSSDRKTLYAAASQVATLSIAEVRDDGKFHLKATVPTVKGARGVVAAKGETAYLIDPAEGRILKLTPK